MRIAPSPAPQPEAEPSPTLPLTRGAQGANVVEAQHQLLHAGFSLPRYGADGQFGGETAAALARFQAKYGLPRTGCFDAATLEALARARPPSPDYDALFADGVLRGVLAVGFDENGAHLREQAAVAEGLTQRGYRPVTDAQRAQWGLDADGRYVARTSEQDGPTGAVVLELITPQTAHARDRFAAALRGQELVLYGGHGRYGSGPDFDDIRSPAGNFVIGPPFEAGHVALGANDLGAAPLMPGYQLMFFDGCNTYRYFDDLRSRTPGKTPQTLDVIGSTTELYWSTTALNLLTALDDVSAREDLGVLERDLDENNRQGPGDQRRYFTGDGFEDNVRPG